MIFNIDLFFTFLLFMIKHTKEIHLYSYTQNQIFKVHLQIIEVLPHRLMPYESELFSIVFSNVYYDNALRMMMMMNRWLPSLDYSISLVEY